eukprot:GEZU01034075.1.p1 GENE.GEZU01034075.1~~GEZU01034075.1.p1  ORF type:complete len:166 (+),score=57.41 GEZU01034075.1:90-587(+)
MISVYCSHTAEDGEEDFVFEGGECSEIDEKFDLIVGKLEEILMDEEFSKLQTKFIEENCEPFEDTEENKLIYTDIFNSYTNTIEKYIENKLISDIPGFSMDEFLEMLSERQEEVSGDIWDMLLSFVDFSEFKDLMVSYKKGRTYDAESSDEVIHVEKKEIHNSSS